jgi:hypothetical protein
VNEASIMPAVAGETSNSRLRAYPFLRKRKILRYLQFLEIPDFRHFALFADKLLISVAILLNALAFRRSFAGVWGFSAVF